MLTIWTKRGKGLVEKKKKPFKDHRPGRETHKWPGGVDGEGNPRIRVPYNAVGVTKVVRQSVTWWEKKWGEFVMVEDGRGIPKEAQMRIVMVNDRSFRSRGCRGSSELPIYAGAEVTRASNYATWGTVRCAKRDPARRDLEMVGEARRTPTKKEITGRLGGLIFCSPCTFIGANLGSRV